MHDGPALRPHEALGDEGVGELRRRQIFVPKFPHPLFAAEEVGMETRRSPRANYGKLGC